eukprot:TRINITY_DN12788_c0_g1_i1.p1 TRINITY_DN12788_c0_g1~~TRINITY_DN12788_c0_g1_i1.p1  ORF type:complete len:203 (+),score=29.82 TRINITY_DN12788_c0_g1_i1:87-695(+)
MDKVYCLSESSEGSLLCPFLREALDSLSGTPYKLHHVDYIGILSHVILLESGFIPLEPLVSQWKWRASNYVKLLYMFPPESRDFTLFVSSLGTQVQILVKDSSSSMLSVNLMPSEYIDLRGISPRFINMSRFNRIVKNQVCLPLSNDARIANKSYPGPESLESLPNEIIVLIAEHLDSRRDLSSFRKASKRIHALLDEKKKS